MRITPRLRRSGSTGRGSPGKLALGLVAAFALVGSAGGVAGAASSGNSSEGVTAKSITLGLIASESGPASSTFGDSAGGALARIDQQNAMGGVNGRKISLEVADDQSTTNGNQLAAQDLVSNKGAFGILSSSAALVGGSNYLLAQGVPVAASDSTITTDEPKYTNQFTSVQGQYPLPETTQIGNFFKKIGVKKVAVLDYSDPQDASTFVPTEKGIEATGLKVCYGSDSLPIGTVNFTTVVLALKQAGCQGLYFPAVEASNLALATAIEQAGLTIKQQYATGYDQTILNEPSARQAAQNQYFEAIVPLDLPTPAVSSFYAALKKYDTAYKGGIATFGTYEGWLTADEMIQGLKGAGVNPTRASVIKSLSSITSYTGGGLVPAVNLSKRWKLAGPQCEYYVQLKGAKFVPFPSNDKPICGKVVGS
jgi:branched-chain amino acid transport system substrate-binding protein